MEGNRGRRPLNENEPIPQMGAPEVPDWLHRWAKELWAFMVPQLEEMGVIGRCDMVDLVALCQSWARWRQAEDLIDREGLTYQSLIALDNEGKPVSIDMAKILMKEHPAMRIIARERAACMTAATHLGLTPTMRSKIIAYKPKEPSESLLSSPEALRGSS